MEQYYSAAYRGLEDQFVTLNSFGEGRPSTRWLRPTELAQAVSDEAGHGNLFHSLGTFQTKVAGRGMATDVSALPGLYLDVDVSAAPEGYRERGNSAKSLDDILSKFESWGFPAPSAVLSTGNGFHLEYWFSEPMRIGSEEDRQAAENLASGFNRYAIQRGKEVGWTLDYVGDLARVKRSLGSTNHKPGPDGQPVPKPVALLAMNPERRYSVDQLQALAERIEKPKHTVQVARSREKIGGDEFPDFEAVLALDPFTQYCVANAASLAEPEWYAFIGLVARCDNGVELAHEYSRLDPRYSYADTERKLRHALEAPGPQGYAAIEEHTGFRLPDDWLFAGRVSNPIQFGYLSPAQARVVSAYVYDLARERYVDVTTLEPLSRNAFRAAHLYELANPPDDFLRTRLGTRVARSDYLPGDPRVVADGERLVLNVYRPSALIPKAGPHDALLGHFRVVFPDEAERNHVLDYLAFAVQNPGRKIKHSLYIWGAERTGKNTIVEMMEAILGNSNVVTLGGEAIGNRFKEDRTNTQLLVLNEVSGISAADTESLKEFITEEMVMIEEKGMPRHQGRTPRAVIVLSNHPNALKLTRGDRRYAVFETASPAPPPHYFDRLRDAWDDEMPGFAEYLGTRDVSHFRPDAPPPFTAAKEDAIRSAQGALGQIIFDAIETRSGVFARDFGTLDEVLDTIQREGPLFVRPDQKTVESILRELGHRSLRKQQRVGPYRLRFWVWRNPEKWMNASGEEFRAETKRVA